MKKERKFTLTVTESQLRLIAACVEDCHRFIAGQNELDHSTCFLPNYYEIKDTLRELHPLIVPELKDWRASYGWDGGTCPNEHQRKFLAQTYCIYREIIHRLTVLNEKTAGWSVYQSETLTCDEGGPLPKVELIKE